MHDSAASIVSVATFRQMIRAVSGVKSLDRQFRFAWLVRHDPSAEVEPMKEALLIQKSESGGGRIYWEEKRSKCQMTRARRLSSPASAMVRLPQRFRASITLRLLGRTHIGVGFDFAPLLFHDATQLALHRFERIVDYL